MALCSMLLWISVPSILDCGGCLAGDCKLWSIRCVNFGGEGSFKLMQDDRPDPDAQMVSIRTYACGAYTESKCMWSV